MTSPTIELIPVTGIPVVRVGDDIAQLTLSALKENEIRMVEGDILVITHSIISIVEGRYHTLEDVEVSERAELIAEKTGDDPRRVEVALRESTTIIREDPVLITRTTQGIITDYSGVDESNAPEGSLIVLPKDPDKSAQRIHQSLSEQLSFNVPVIITDTLGRPWRKGAVNHAIGVAGMSPFVVNRGKEDLYERELRGSLVCLADQVAAATELVMGQADEGVPVVIVRGIKYESGEGSASEILRDSSDDLFSK